MAKVYIAADLRTNMPACPDCFLENTSNKFAELFETEVMVSIGIVY